ncbi:extracellular solute-binding protein [Mycoplasma iguanae]|uniref:Extracellular solute-binding protein n=1 Tax=Mycoplasma iguanae TaxID=292461 RepID=A0ABY5R8S5_9MOLU|nr:extracellular solute-binding protein [Mycoplasma iguanae]UVD81904.1 extracellular solute-binding protein [Mycoplasma iguanae]
MKNNKFKWLSALTLATTPVVFLAACASTAASETNSKLFEAMSKDQLAINLKTSLAGYSTEAMEIISNKQEISQQSKDLIDAFNKFYGTKLSYTQIGGSTDYGQFLATKFANGVGNVLLLSGGSLAGFQDQDNILIDTPSSKMLANETSTIGQYVVGNKRYMAQTIESYGVIYNRDAFQKAKITVFEGQPFETTQTKPAELPADKPQNYNGTIKVGETLYVFTDDLNLEGWKAIISQVKNAGLKPFYTTSKATSGNIWPLTNHLLGAVVTAQTGLKPSNLTELQDAEKVLTDSVMQGMKDGLEIYGQNETYNRNTNTVDIAMQQVAFGREYAMSQNGTWATPQIKQANPNANVGFLPLPVFDATSKTSKIVKTVSQRWGATTLANDPAKLKTAQLFLQFLYQTKSGAEYAANEMQLSTPYGQVSGVSLEINDPLSKSQSQYLDSDIIESVDNYFVQGFNNQNQVLVSAVNSGFANPTEEKTKLTAEWNRLKNSATDK